MSEVCGNVIASGSAGPHMPPESNSGSSESNVSQGPRQTMPVSELVEGFQEKIIEIEHWIRSMVHNGTVFEVQPAERDRVGADFRLQGSFLSGEFKLNWNEILSPDQRAGASYSFGSGAGGWRGQPSCLGRTDITIVRENRNGEIGRGTQSPRVCAGDDNERSTQRE